MSEVREQVEGVALQVGVQDVRVFSIVFGFLLMPLLTESERERLVAKARQAVLAAYAPYSQYRVGAAVELEDGRVFAGCNVENVSYGLTNCAERTAVFAAVAASGGEKIAIRAAAVVNGDGSACSPCGACRQVLAEFSRAATEIFYSGKNGMVRVTMDELLPDCFCL